MASADITADRLAAFRQTHPGARFEFKDGAWLAFNLATGALLGSLRPSSTATYGKPPGPNPGPGRGLTS